MGTEDGLGSGYPYEELRIDIEKVLNSLGPPLSGECCIYRVPKRLRDINESAYIPQVISIGPFHRGREGLRAMEKMKQRYLKKLLQVGAGRADLRDLLATIKGWERRIRRCYAESLDDVGSDEFVKMILFDAAFIIELFRKCRRRDYDAEDRIMISTPRLMTQILYDLILLENQIPLFVVDGVYELIFTPCNRDDNPPFIELASRVFCAFSSFQLKEEYVVSLLNREKRIRKKVKHFPDLLRFLYLPPSSEPASTSRQGTTHTPTPNDRRDKGGTRYLHKATKMHEAGVEFKMSPSPCLLEIKFDNGELQIPHLKLYNGTEIILRNLMALEQCRYPFDTAICKYVQLINGLINDGEDVDLLVRRKVVYSGLGDSDAAANMVNSLRSEVLPVCKHFSDVVEGLQHYCEVRHHRWRAALKRDYFSTPWRSFSTTAAVLLLSLTLLQTICAIISLRTF